MTNEQTHWERAHVNGVVARVDKIRLGNSIRYSVTTARPHPGDGVNPGEVAEHFDDLALAMDAADRAANCAPGCLCKPWE